MRREVLTWSDVDELIDHLVPQFETELDAMVMITRGGIIPGGLLAEALNIQSIFTASVDFPAETEIEESRKEKSRLLAWPHFLQFPSNDVLAGKYDDYIDQFARDAKAFNQRVLMRFLHEFNGNWYVWSGNKNGGADGGPEKVVAVWKYVVDRFRKIGADNVKWLWVPHGPSTDLSTEPWNNVSNYWPGDEYVDWIGLDGYNFYPKDPWGGTRPLRDFDNCFRALYDSCAVLGDQPMMIAEFGTGEFEYEDFDKATWITDAFSKIKTEYPRLKIFTWFNINKELDWRVNSSPEALDAFRKAMEDPYFIGSPYKQ